MKVYLLKNIDKVGFAGEIIKTKPGFANNYLLPQKLAIEITPANEKIYTEKAKEFDRSKEAVAEKTSALAEKIKSLKLTVKRKIHDDEKLYASVDASDVVDLLSKEGIKITKNQVMLKKAIKKQGVHNITIKLSSQLMPEMVLKIVPENTGN